MGSVHAPALPGPGRERGAATATSTGSRRDIDTEHMRTVLVVDDDERVRQVVRAQLQGTGFFVVEVASGEDALELCRDLAPHVVVLDLYLQGMQGVEVCRRLKERRDQPYVSVVMLSASGTRADIVAGLEAGADDFLTKPISMTELRLRVSNLAKVSEYHRYARAERDAALKRVDELNGQLLRTERLASVGTLTAGICHELNNIGQVLAGAVDELECAGLSGEAAEALPSLASATKHVHELAKSLLRVVRVDKQATATVPFCAVAEEVFHMLKLTGRTKHVDVLLSSTPEVSVRAAKVEIQQVLLNLVGNAADALAWRSKGRIEVTTRDQKGVLEVEVRDNGPGMSAEVAARVFEPFFTTKPVGEGTGLGLSVVKRIVEGWGGELKLSTELERGTSFTFGIPKA
jgi:C4-dicarboxylate-specific signal transduction histidine kinase